MLPSHGLPLCPPWGSLQPTNLLFEAARMSVYGASDVFRRIVSLGYVGGLSLEALLLAMALHAGGI